MMGKRTLFILTLFLFFLPAGVMAWDEEEPKWALGYGGSVFLKPFLSEHIGIESPGRGFRDFAVWGEYYLPRKWNVTAGYFRTEVDYGISYRHMEGLHLGVKKFFVPQNWALQPYLTMAPRFNWGRHREIHNYQYPEDNSWYRQYSRNPRFSLMTGAGAEVYVFSCVAFTVEYNIGMGLDSRTEIEYSHYGRNGKMGDHGLYHHVALGVKVTFPFRVSREDGNNLLNLLLETTFWQLEKRARDYYY